ncbi:MAG: quinone-interacting membrane-bound oxidoreductase complex subunit QmoC [Desulfobaccales bacterium]
MAGATLIKPDLQFVKRIVAAGGDTAKKCYQCDTCDVVCNLSPDERPFPRKEMLMAQWGQKDVLKDPDIWLCHACSDCTVHCPRGAKPGEVLGVLRQMCIENYAFPPILAKMVGDIKFLPALIALPVILLLVWLYGLGMLGIKVAGGVAHKGLAFPEGKIVFSKMFPTLWAVDAIFVPAFFFAVGVLSLGVMRFWKDLNEANPWKVKLQGNIIGHAVPVIKDILFHNRFRECETTFGRALNHLLLVFGFIFLAIVTSWGFLREWVFHFDSPYTLFWPPDPLKWLALLGTGLLIFGIYRIYTARQENAETAGYGTYYDWQLIYIIAAVGLTGALSWVFRLLGSPTLAYPTYFLHLVSIFCLFFYAPYTKIAHLVYRTVAMLYARMSERGF